MCSVDAGIDSTTGEKNHCESELKFAVYFMKIPPLNSLSPMYDIESRKLMLQAKIELIFAVKRNQTFLPKLGFIFIYSPILLSDIILLIQEVIILPVFCSQKLYYSFRK